ncbi:MAG TPA: VOC family protein [Casimicrobiaceae bacterium]|jgi:PhnB protein|nr:VOC family protein [Casimicrobiaceae bacterium]
MSVQAIPAGYEGVTPYLIVRDAAAAIEYYKKAFGASELMRFAGKDGRIGHAELKIGRGIVMLADEVEGHQGPQTLGGTPVSLMFYVDDVDAVFARAVAAGGKAIRPVADQFYGDRGGGISDPFGHSWWIATHKEDVAPEEMQKRMQAMG